MTSGGYRACALAASLLWAGSTLAANVATTNARSTVPESAPGVAQGYLAYRAALPDSAALLPPPPAEGSPALTLDQQTSDADLAVQGSPRWKQAARDANLTFPWAAGDFACALDVKVNITDTPRLYGLLRRTMSDAATAARAAKDRYKRPRPFMANKAPTCTPGAEEHLALDGGYPSGHATVGWTWALALAEISPDQAQAVLARGRAFGQSRVVCNVHWQSDVAQGRTLAAALVARLHADSTFLADMEAAKAELVAARAKKLPPQRDCQGEAAALAADAAQTP